jgi:hypothetical protein
VKVEKKEKEWEIKGRKGSKIKTMSLFISTISWLAQELSLLIFLSLILKP